MKHWLSVDLYKTASMHGPHERGLVNKTQDADGVNTVEVDIVKSRSEGSVTKKGV